MTVLMSPRVSSAPGRADEGGYGPLCCFWLSVPLPPAACALVVGMTMVPIEAHTWASRFLSQQCLCQALQPFSFWIHAHNAPSCILALQHTGSFQLL